jgi:hypothetical protein
MTTHEKDHLETIRRAHDATRTSVLFAISGKRLDILDTVHVEIAQTAQGKFGSLPVEGISIAIERSMVCGGIASVDDPAGVERVGEYLQN